MIKPLKTAHRRCRPLSVLLNRYKRLAEREIDYSELARRCGVIESSAKKWFYGYTPSKYIYSHIARYFAEILPLPAEQIREQIEQAIRQWREQK